MHGILIKPSEPSVWSMHVTQYTMDTLLGLELSILVLLETPAEGIFVMTSTVTVH